MQGKWFKKPTKWWDIYDLIFMVFSSISLLFTYSIVRIERLFQGQFNILSIGWRWTNNLYKVYDNLEYVFELYYSHFLLISAFLLFIIALFALIQYIKYKKKLFSWTNFIALLLFVAFIFTPFVKYYLATIFKIFPWSLFSSSLLIFINIIGY